MDQWGYILNTEYVMNEEKRKEKAGWLRFHTREPIHSTLHEAEIKTDLCEDNSYAQRCTTFKNCLPGSIAFTGY